MQYFSDVWKHIDLNLIIFGIFGTILRIKNQSESDLSRIILSVASIFAWFKLLYFFRPFLASSKRSN